LRATGGVRHFRGTNSLRVWSRWRRFIGPQTTAHRTPNRSPSPRRYFGHFVASGAQRCKRQFTVGV